MKIVVDAFGGDNAPEEVVKGTLLALKEDKNLEIVLVGDKNKIEPALGLEYDKERLLIVHAKDVIANEDNPTTAVMKKKESSLVVALQYLNDNPDAKAFVSAGSTGAVLTASVLYIKRMKGVTRPGLAPLLPTVNGKNVLLIDCGANSDPKPENLVEFARLGAGLMSSVYGVSSPRVALLSNGTEVKKGNELTKAAFNLLIETELNFVGNMEARELLSGDYDVVVSDGFSGNVALKSAEGTALAVFSLLKDGIMNGGAKAKLGYLLLKPVLKDLKKKLDYSENGGAALLGLEKIVVKAHGSSKAKTLKASILQAKSYAESGFIEKTKRSLEIE